MKKKAEESEPLTKENWKEEVFKKNISNELGIMIYVLNNFFYCFFFAWYIYKYIFIFIVYAYNHHHHHFLLSLYN
jgi:hypothetical protein